MAFGRIAGYEWTIGGTKQVAYWGHDGHIHELSVGSGESWSHKNVTGDLGLAPLSGLWDLAGFDWKAGKSKQIVYRTTDGHFHQLVKRKNQNWQTITSTSFGSVKGTTGSMRISLR